MRVKELLLDALSRANHIEDGTPADARELTKARKFFNSALATYSDSNLITAFQNFIVVDGKEEQVLGKYNLKRGKVMHEAAPGASLPDPTRLTMGKDFGHYQENDTYYFITDTIHGRNEWVQAAGAAGREQLVNLDVCEYIPDVIVPGMERVTSAMARPKNAHVGYNKLSFVPLSEFFVDGGEETYCAIPQGDNKVKLFLPKELDGWEIRLIYYTSMKFSEDDYIELPEVYRELLALATTVALLSEDADSDPTQLNNYSAQLSALEHQIGGNNVNTRRLIRPTQNYNGSALHTGSFISGRFHR